MSHIPDGADLTRLEKWKKRAEDNPIVAAVILIVIVVGTLIPIWDKVVPQISLPLGPETRPAHLTTWLQGHVYLDLFTVFAVLFAISLELTPPHEPSKHSLQNPPGDNNS